MDVWIDNKTKKYYNTKDHTLRRGLGKPTMSWASSSDSSSLRIKLFKMAVLRTSFDEFLIYNINTINSKLYVNYAHVQYYIKH